MLSPRSMQKLHGYLTLLWAIAIPIAVVTGWVYSIVFVSAISLYANVAGHFASWQAARTEVMQEKEMEEREKRDKKLEEKL